MKYLQLTTILFFSCILITSCSKVDSKIANSEDYNKYLFLKENKKEKDLNTQLEFWNKKMNKDSSRIFPLSKASNIYGKLFQATGNIIYLKKAEKALERLVEKAAVGKASFTLALARNYITQHRFKEAKLLAEQVNKIGAKKDEVEKVLFDLAMELGDYKEAKQYLDGFANEKDYNYLIRVAKWNDYTGNLNMTIVHMEKALEIAIASKNEELMLWSYTNLADYYGHAGRIKDSYDFYLKSLEIDPNNAYAKKGIAWIEYSYEKNPEQALDIIKIISKNHTSPDYELLKSEIAEYMGDVEKKEQFVKNYLTKVENPMYGVMYNTYSAMVMAEDLQNYDSALKIAEQEVENRPTPASYDLLAYVLLLKGETQKSLEIANKYIVGKTYEPDASFHLAKLYKATGNTDKSNALKMELEESAYELGPVVTNSISKL